MANWANWFDMRTGFVAMCRTESIKESSNLAAQTQSDARGGYLFPSLRLGIYRETAQVGGFRQLVKSGIEVHVNEGLEINLSLVLGTMSESVAVTAGAPLVESQTGAIRVAPSRDGLYAARVVADTISQITPALIRQMLGMGEYI